MGKIKVNVKDVVHEKCVRKTFSKIGDFIDIPNLLKVQKDSYEWFVKEGLGEVLRDISPIEDYSGNLVLEFFDYYMEENDNYENIYNEEIPSNESDIESNYDDIDITNEEEVTSDNKNDENILIDKTNEESNEIIKNEESEIILKNGFYDEDGITYYYENDNKITGIKNIDGVDNYFSPAGRYLGTSNIKIIDISYYQGDINWDEFVLNGDFYGVILRIGYYSFPDKKFEEYIENVKRLNIPYGIYLFSYAGDIDGSKREASFTNNMIDKYNLTPTLGIYYDIESWTSKNATSDNISKSLYDEIIENYINTVSNHVNYLYKVKVYSGRWYAMNRLGNSKKYVDWVAEYNSSCLYDEPYSMWQYTSVGIAPGINGNVDISYLLT